MATAEFSRIRAADRRAIAPFLKMKPVPLGKMAAALGVQVVVSALPPGKSGKISKVDGRYEIKVNRHEARERQRFTLAHELSHYLLHRDILDEVQEIEDTVLYRSGQPERIEFEANRLAADLIMPDDVMQPDLARLRTVYSDDAFDALATEWQVSKAALEIKLGPVYSG